MQLRYQGARGGRLKLAAIAALGLTLLILLWRPIAQVGGLALGAALIAFLADPIVRRLERRLPRPAASLCGLLGLSLSLGGALWLLLPALLRQLKELTRTLPALFAQLTSLANGIASRLEARLPGLSLTNVDLSALNGALAGVATGTVTLAANVAGFAAKLSLMAVLAYFVLRDRERVLLRLELLVPRRWRGMIVRMGVAVCRELRAYLRGQLLIALAVAVLAAVGLLLAGVKGALALGAIVGLMNMIPYFGPYIGGVPAVLVALSDGWQRAALTALTLAVIQQLDGSIVSPRILGSVTGLSPALVLVGIYAGARVAGVAGMLAALPILVAVRTVYRVSIQKL